MDQVPKEGLRKFVDAFSEEDADKPITLQALDRAFANWLDVNDEDNKRVNAAINVVGIAFDQALVKAAGSNGSSRRMRHRLLWNHAACSMTRWS
jgi:hypothetical protein